MFDFIITDSREVITQWGTVTVSDYQRMMSPKDFTSLCASAHSFIGERILFISATPQGGGVALMRHTLMTLYRLLGVDAHWHVLLPDADVFEITKKKFHNVLQAVAHKDVRLTQEDKELYLRWTEQNFFVLREALNAADVIVIDDPQPAGLIPHIRRDNPDARIIYRSHIQIEASLVDILGTPQQETWSFLWQFIKEVDEFISHPIKAFVPKVVRESLPVEEMPATTDPLDGLNRTLSEIEMQEKLDKFNELLIKDGQTPLDPTCPYLVQIARFDPSKGLPDLLESYTKFLALLKKFNPTAVIPQLVIAGNGSIDDPDGMPLLRKTKAAIASIGPQEAQHIKVARLDPDDELLNTLLRKALFVFQLSTKEGFEVKVTEALMKGKPVIAYRAGGIPLQIENPHDGYLVDIGNTDLVAQRAFELVTNPGLLSEMSAYASIHSYARYQTAENATRWITRALATLGRSQKVAS